MKKTCVHFTGIQNNRCKAGNDYDSFPRGTLPCLGDQIGKGPKSPCADLRLPTPEETAAEESAWQEAFARTSKAVEAASNHAKARGLRKGNGGAGNLPCPVCNTGTLGYSVAEFNGHLHGRCDTKGCVWWMQ